MNVLAVALTQIQNLVQNQKVEVQCFDSKNINGVNRPSETKISSIAHIQPATPQEVKQITAGVASASEIYLFWFIGDDLQVIISALSQSNESYVIWNNKKFYIYSKEDWSLNGWVKVIGALKGKNA